MRRNRKISRNIGKQSEEGTLKFAAAMARHSTERLKRIYKRTCVKNGSKNSYRYGRSARIFTPPSVDNMVDRRGEQLAKTED